jgi:hypothetical protein
MISLKKKLASVDALAIIQQRKVMFQLEFDTLLGVVIFLP